MEEYFLRILISIGILLALMIPGYILRKLKLVHRVSLPTLVTILLYVCGPFLMINAFLYHEEIGNPFDGGLLTAALFVFLISFTTQLLVFLIAKLVLLKNKNRDAAKVYNFAATFGNVGYIGIPFIDFFFRNADAKIHGSALIFAAIFNVTFNMLFWTVGVYCLTGDKKLIRPLRAFLNPSVIVIVISIPLFLLKVGVPDPNRIAGAPYNMTVIPDEIITLIKYFASMTVPLSMIIVGMRLADIKFKEVFKGVWTYIAAALRLLAAPLIMFLLILPLWALGAFGTEATFYSTYGYTAIITLLSVSALPVAASTIIFCEKYRADYQSGLKAFMSSTLLALVTMPLILSLLFLAFPVP